MQRCTVRWKALRLRIRLRTRSEGKCWLVAAGAGGAWIGKDGSLAIWSAGGWRFIEPFVGLSAWDKAGGYFVRWTGQQWSEGDFPVASLSVQGKKVVGAGSRRCQVLQAER
jgi:hypothetical protein